MNKWQKFGLAAGMGATVITATHLLNKFIFKTATAHNYTGKRIRDYYPWKFGEISYSVCGIGTPLLLVHDLNSYSSQYEWDNVISILSKKYMVYTLDLLGCGHSDKPNITYTTYMYTQLLNDFVVNVIHKRTNVIATGDSAPMVIMSAYNNPVIFDKIALVSPQSVKNALKTPGKHTNITRFLLNMPVIGTTIYNICMNKGRLNKLMSKKLFDNGIIPVDVLNAYHENAHLSGSSSKFLFTSTECCYTTAAISKAVSELNNCIYIINGEHCNKDATDEYTSLNSSIEVIQIPNAKKLPQIEQPIEFANQMNIYFSQS